MAQQFILTITLAITSVFGGGGGRAASPPKDSGTLKKRLRELADALKKLAGKEFKDTMKAYFY